MTCRERRDLMLLYVAGALEPAEVAELREHLRSGCPTCAGGLAEAEATVHQIPLSLPLQQAPDSAWEKLEMRIALHDDATPVAARAENRRVAEMTLPARRPTPFAWSGWAAAAAVAIFMGLLLHNANQHMTEAFAKLDDSSRNLAITQQALMMASDQSNQLNARMVSLEQKVKDLDAERGKLLVAVNESRSDFRTRVEKLLHAQQFALSAGTLPGVTGTLFWNKNEGTWTLFASHVKPLPAGKAYELWIIPKNGSPIAAGTFSPDAAGDAMHEVPIPADAGPLAIAAVTDEPAGGVQKPTGTIQFSTDVTKTQ